ncbi:hypothetical protein [Pseudodesulfovibrio sp. S3]|uniref:hypothetical protein n=1 Tax=Pseudodesulfovibrio sp. S3 TaxID=2283629 RepID=UPI0013E2BB97|nr:hypothetical protein [Pseudodesulfovibrio sp. S3]MCJ2164119.1 hypothetical protein [Pseudodesulfovibrio sp. S3-i]
MGKKACGLSGISISAGSQAQYLTIMQFPMNYLLPPCTFSAKQLPKGHPRSKTLTLQPQHINNF